MKGDYVPASFEFSSLMPLHLRHPSTTTPPQAQFRGQTPKFSCASSHCFIILNRLRDDGGVATCLDLLPVSLLIALRIFGAIHKKLNQTTLTWVPKKLLTDRTVMPYDFEAMVRSVMVKALRLLRACNGYRGRST